MNVTGVCILRMDGLSLRSKEGAKLSYGGKERTPQYADGVLVGPSAKPVAATVTASLVHCSDSDLQAIADAENVTILFETDTGKKYTVRAAFSTKPPELTGGEGEVAVEFAGQPAFES